MLRRFAHSLVRQHVGTASLTTRAASANVHTLPDLDYDYDALAPVIGPRIMELHHSKHHQTYVNNLNALLEQHHEATEKGDTAKLAALEPALRFNGGGHINHSEFWNSLAPTSAGGGEPPAADSVLGKAIVKEFGSFDNFVAKFNAQTTAVQGSGWGWLVYRPMTEKLSIMTTGNQDRPQDVQPVVPVLGIDVWEHAYYLDYENRRPDYLKNIWNVVNWNTVASRFDVARKVQ